MSQKPNWLHKVSFRFQWQALPITKEIFLNWNIVLLREKKEAEISKLNFSEIQWEDHAQMSIQTILCIYVNIYMCVSACLCREGCYSTNSKSYNSNILVKRCRYMKSLIFVTWQMYFLQTKTKRYDNAMNLKNYLINQIKPSTGFPEWSFRFFHAWNSRGWKQQKSTSKSWLVISRWQ